MHEREMTWRNYWSLLIGISGIGGTELVHQNLTITNVFPDLMLNDLQVITELIKLGVQLGIGYFTIKALRSKKS